MWSDRKNLLYELHTEKGSEETLNIYDFCYWENTMTDDWLRIFNEGLKDFGYTYKLWTLYRPDKNNMVLTLVNEHEEVQIKMPYREKFRFTWQEFLDRIKEQLLNMGKLVQR